MHSYIEMKDIIGRTALIIAIHNKHDEVIRVLLMNHASPWSENIKYDLNLLTANYKNARYMI
jgi:ankyrin repeat protein